MSKFIKPMIQLGAMIIGELLGGPLLAVAFTIGATILTNALFKPSAPERQASETTLQLGEGPRRYVFGRCATAGALADAFNYGGKYGTDWEVLVIDIADHFCDALEGFYVDDTYHAYSGDGSVSGFNSQLSIWWVPGTEGQSVPSILTSQGGWSANDRARGCARVVVAYKSDASDAKNPVFPGGRPRFLFVVRGARLYDPRKDSTVEGGAGAHRWDNPATWEWSRNAELARYTFQRGIYACNRIDQPDMLLVGRGLSAIEAPPAAIIAAANICDEDVALAAGGTEKRYSADGVIDATEEFGAVEEEFARAMGGIVIQVEGAVMVEPGHAKVPVRTITDADFIAGTPIKFERERGEADEEWCNTISVRYVEPSQKWKDHSAPVRRDPADVIADGGARERTLTLRFVTSGTQAQRIGEIARRMGRLQKTGGFTLGPQHLDLEAGDWINWVSERRPERSGTYRIQSDAQGAEWRNQLSLREIATSVFNWSTANEGLDGSVAEQQDAPSPYAPPDPADWNVAPVTSDAGGLPVAALEFTGAVGDPYATGIVFEFRVEDPGNGPDDNWLSQQVAPTVTVARTLTGLAGGESYEAAVSYQYGGVTGARLILGPVTTDAVDLVIDGQVEL